MQLALSHPGWQRWKMPILLGIIVALLSAALPGAPLQILARDAGLVKHLRTEIATLRAVRTGFAQARAAGQDVLSGRPSKAQTLAISGVRRALDRMTGEPGPVSESAAALQEAIEVYTQALARAVAVERYAEPALQPLQPDAPANTIGSLLGQLQVRDEARLQEPLLAMRLAEAALRTERNPRLAEQVSLWAGIFAARLDEMTIPQGTRANLITSLVAYQHAVLSVRDMSFRQQVDLDRPLAAARLVETALANADSVLAGEQQRVTHAFEIASNGLLWLFAAVLGVSLFIVGGGLFGRMALAHGAAHARHAR